MIPGPQCSSVVLFGVGGFKVFGDLGFPLWALVLGLALSGVLFEGYALSTWRLLGVQL